MAIQDAQASEKQTTDRKFVSEAVLIAAASALSYAVAYAYRSGFASYFGLPPLLLTPTVGGILQAAAAVGLILLNFWNVLNPVWIFLPRKNLALGRNINRMLLALLLLILVSYSYLTSWWIWVIIAALMLLMGSVFLIFPLIAWREILGYENKLLAQEESARRNRTLWNEAGQRIGVCYRCVFCSSGLCKRCG